MCGIIGYIGKKHPKEILINGLKKLEYRGYDSAGIAIKNTKEIQIIKSVGKISNLEEKLTNEILIDANVGIAHTRWATHGEPSEINAHPHTVGNITLVHNGIIENAKELKARLEKENVEFKSTTDTEVAAALINHYYQGDMEDAINKAIKDIKGSYAFGILCKNDNKLYAIRSGSPLILGVGYEEYFITSDIGAILKYTNKYILLEENCLVTIDYDGYQISHNKKKIVAEIQLCNLNNDDTELQNYDHYMIKEIMEEPILVNKFIDKHINELDKLPDLNKYEELHIVGCGSAYYAGMIGKNFYEEDGIKVEIDVASEYRYRNIKYDRKTLVILISQSGETADTIAAMRKANEKGIDTLAIVNQDESTIARECTHKVLIEAGREVAVATTKAFIQQVLVLSLLSYKLNTKDNSYLDDIRKVGTYLTSILEDTEKYKNIAKLLNDSEDVFFIGRKIDYAISLEGSLKLKEVSYIHSEAYQAGELKHGTISLINKGTIVFAIVTDDNIREKTISNLEEVISRGAIPIYIGTQKEHYQNNIIIPKIHSKLQPLLVIPPLQLIAYYVALQRDCSIDQPKNLAKSVTVE